MSIQLENNILKETKLKNGDTLILRKPTTEDAVKMIQYLNTVGGESNNLLFGKGEFRLSVEQEMEHIKNVNADTNSLMLIGTINDNIVSIAGIMTSNRKRIAHNGDVAISVKKEYWSKGIGSEVMSELINFAKKNGTIKNVSLGVRSGNENAIKLYEKFGFQKVGLHRNFFNVDGNFYDEILMDLYL